MVNETKLLETERSMVDTNVLIFAFRKVRENDDADLCGWRDASIRLLKSMKRIRVSAIAWMEFLRGIHVDDQAAAMYRKIQPEAVDGRMVTRALELVNARKLRETLCKRCFNALKANPCPASLHPREA
jgi:hypothetical protein